MWNCGTYREGSGELSDGLSDSGSGGAAVPEMEAKHPLPVEAAADIHSLPSLPVFICVPHHETCQEGIETESGTGDVFLHLVAKTEKETRRFTMEPPTNDLLITPRSIRGTWFCPRLLVYYTTS